MNTRIPTMAAAGVSLLSTQALAHHSDEAHLTLLGNFIELVSVGIAFVAIASLVVLLLKPSR